MADQSESSNLDRFLRTAQRWDLPVFCPVDSLCVGTRSTGRKSGKSHHCIALCNDKMREADF